MIPNDIQIQIHSVPVLAIPTHGGGYRGAWSIGREYLSTERQRVGRFARFTTTLNHPQVKGRVIALLDMMTAKTEIYVEQFELSPDLVTRCYAIAGVSLDARYTNTGAGPARRKGHAK